MNRNRLVIPQLTILALAAVLVVIWLGVPRDPYSGKLASYLPFHIFAETLSVVVSLMIFAVMWNAYSAERPGGIVALSCAMFAAGLIDFGHMLSVSHMPDFVTPSGPEKGIAFWLASRFVVAIGFIAAAWQGDAPLAKPRSRYVLLALAVAVTALTYWVVLFHPDVLPRTFEPGTGLTAVKVGAEYLVVAAMIVPAVVFYRRARRTGAAIDVGLFAAVSVTILGEMYFVIYAAAHDLFQVLGHGYKIVAYLLLWHAVFVVCVREPFERARELSHRLVAVEEYERRNLAMIVHDTISPNLAATSIQLELIRSELPVPIREALDDRFEDARALVKDTDASMRDLCSNLRHPMLDCAGLLPAVKDYVERFANRTGIAVSVDGNDSGVRLTRDVETTLFRIIQEALTNCAKHAAANHIRISLWHDAECVRLAVEDDGKGFDFDGLGSSGPKPGHGLLSMYERAQLAGATFNLASAPGNGTRIAVQL